MSDTQNRTDSAGADAMSALFAQLILQQSNMAMLLLGRVAHPETGKVVKDIEGARLFIDQLEMLEAKTKGNLTKEEDGLLKQSLMTLRLAFVESVESPEAKTSDAQPAAPEASASPGPGSAEAAAPADDEHRKKFSKKY